MKKKYILLTCCLLVSTLAFALNECDTTYLFRPDTLFAEITEFKPKVAVRTNLAYAASATPNLGFEFALGDNVTLGANVGLKWFPRWLPWDTDKYNPQKWKHLLIVPEFRWWPQEVYERGFIGIDLIYTHYNAGSLTFPLGMYPEVRDRRLQGDFYGIGLFAGWSWRLSRNFRIEAEAGIGAGYHSENVYECAYCGSRIGQTSGPVIIPIIGVNLAWDFGREEIREEIFEIIRSPEPDEPPPAEIPEDDIPR